MEVLRWIANGGAEVTVLEFLGGIGGAGIDEEIAKLFKKMLAKQVLKFINSNPQGDDRPVVVKTEPAKGGSKELFEADVVPIAIGQRHYAEGLRLDVEVDERWRVVGDSLKILPLRFASFLPRQLSCQDKVGHRGLIEVPIGAETDRILGVHIIGPNAGDMIASAVLVIEYTASAEDMSCPTLGEPFKGEAMASYNKTIISKEADTDCTT